MEPFTRVCGTAAPILEPNIDTGLLAHSQWCRDHPRDLAPGLFRDWRFDAEGNPLPGFVLHQPRYRDCRILLGGANFGCGSSRETAVWALAAFGIRCVIAPSFGDIFRDNAYQNGLLPLALPAETVARLAAAVQAAPEPTLCVDLAAGVVEAPGMQPIAFSLPPDRRLALLEGLDETLLIRRSEAAIAAFQARDRAGRPWVYAGAADRPAPD